MSVRSSNHGIEKERKRGKTGRKATAFVTTLTKNCFFNAVWALLKILVCTIAIQCYHIDFLHSSLLRDRFWLWAHRSFQRYCSNIAVILQTNCCSNVIANSMAWELSWYFCRLDIMRVVCNMTEKGMCYKQHWLFPIAGGLGELSRRILEPYWRTKSKGTDIVNAGDTLITRYWKHER